MEELIKRLSRYSEQCIAERLDPDFAAAIIEAINVLSLCQMLGAKPEPPVVHGEWVEKETFHDENADVISEWQSARCSVCNKYHTTPYLYCFTDYNFCPDCGARMEGGT